MRLLLFPALFAASLAAGGALAHHGWGSYDVDRKFTIRAPVATLAWGNPHVTVRVPHAGATWDAVLAPPFRMENRGLTLEMIAQGAEVAIEGYPSSREATEMRAERITVSGRTFELR